MKLFQVGLNYSAAAKRCADIGAEIVQPVNDLESETLATILSNYSGVAVWIGLFFNSSLTS